jgi:hypothetical protein
MNERKAKEYTGQVYTSKAGDDFEVIEYHGASNVLIKFLDNGYCKKVTMGSIKSGSIRNDRKIELELDQIRCLKKNTTELAAKIKRAEDLKKAKEDYDKVYTAHVNTDYSICVPEIKLHPNDYPMIQSRWKGIIDRCTPSKQKGKYGSYVGCSLCEEWKDFQNFCEWCLENKICEGMDIDKDVLIKGNKVYSPETCIIIPSEINSRLNFNIPLRDTLMGVTKNVLRNGYSYKARFGKGDSGRVELGTFKTELEAHQAWANYRKSLIIPLVEQYKYAITDKAYQALKNYSFLQV